MAYMDEIDDRAFNRMQEVTTIAPERMFEDEKVFTESPYNTTFDDLARYNSDRHSFKILQELYDEDKAKSASIQDWDFDRYLKNLKSSRLEEAFLESKEEDPEFYRTAGKLLRDVYADDVEQLKLSAYNFYASKGRMGAPIDRSNVSVKAPTGGDWQDKGRYLDERTP